MIKLWIDKEGRELDGWKKLIKKATRAKAKAKMQLASRHNIDQCCYRGSQPVHTSLDKASNSKDFRIEKSKPKAQEPKALNSNSSSLLNQRRNTETSNKAWKKKEKALDAEEIR